MGAFALAGLLGSAASAEPIAFTNVNLAPMTGPSVVRSSTVLVDEGKIVAIGRDVVVPEGSKVIDGRGELWLSPGLADMHVHSTSKSEMTLYLANGVTTILNMGDAPAEFVGRTRKRIGSGQWRGPRVFAAYVIDGAERYGHTIARDASTTEAALRLAKANGYDFVKVYNDLPADSFEAAVRVGGELGMPIAGHGTSALGLEKQLGAGQAVVAHLEEFFYTLLFHEGEAQGDEPPPLARIGDAVELLRRTNSAVIADLGTYRNLKLAIGHPERLRECAASAEAENLSPDTRLDWLHSGYGGKTAKLDARLDYLGRLVVALRDGGVPLLAGTDAPTIPCAFPGVALHDNLDALVAAGFTPYEALSTATSQPGAFLHERLGAPKAGVIQPGAAADMILSRANPLEDLSTLREPIGVLANGRWYEKAELANSVAAIRTGYAALFRGKEPSQIAESAQDKK